MTDIIVWLLLIISLLVLAVFIIIYIRGFFRPRTPYQVYNLPDPTAWNFTSIVSGLSDSFIAHGEVKNFFIEAEEIFAARFEVIRNATKSIQFETFIMTQGDRADEFAIALAQKAAQGVRIKVLVDDYGTNNISKQYWHRLRDSGVEVRFFNRFTWGDPFYYLVRNHRKLLIVDGETALIGGAGISDFWDGEDGKEGNIPWYDYEVCLQGSVISRLQCIFWKHWLDAGGNLDLSEEHFVENYGGKSHVIVSAGEDPTQRDSGIRSLFQSLIQSAKKRIWIASPYFLPDPNSLEIFLQVKSKGIDIRILTMGPRTDKPPVRFASRQRYPKLIKADIPIYEYQPSMMHAKAILIDDEWASVGSANFDPRSFFRNDELNIATDDKFLVKRIEKLFEKGFFCSQRIGRQDLQNRGIKERIVGRLMMLLFWQL